MNYLDIITPIDTADLTLTDLAPSPGLLGALTEAGRFDGDSTDSEDAQDE